MPMERMTAKKVRIADLTGGEWVRKEGMEPSFVLTAHGDQVSRARVLATVVGRFVAEDQAFASVTLDDQTDTIRAKTFQTAQPLQQLAVGDRVDIVGKVREYQGEVYLIPEAVRIIADPNWETLRRLDIIAQRRRQAAPTSMNAGQRPAPERERDAVRKQALAVIEKRPDGAPFADLLKLLDAPEPVIESVIDELLAEGICYEPSPGKIRKI